MNFIKTIFAPAAGFGGRMRKVEKREEPKIVCRTHGADAALQIGQGVLQRRNP